MRFILSILIITMCYSCCEEQKEAQKVVSDLPSEFVGTWQLISSDYHSKDTVTSSMKEGQQMMKIITPTHFAFFLNDLKQGKDSSNVAFSAGGGTVEFKDGQYIENLQYFSAREWEGHQFSFKLELNGDTLTQQGVEELADLGLGEENLLLIEKYIKVKN